MPSASELFREAAGLEVEPEPVERTEAEKASRRAERARRRDEHNGTLGRRDRVLFGLDPEPRPEPEVIAVIPAANTQAAKQIRKLSRRDGLKCHYCKKVLTFETATRDHIVPRSAGGPSALANLVLACKKCNGAKGDMDYETFIATRKGKLKVKPKPAPHTVKPAIRFKLEGSHPDPDCEECAKRPGNLVCTKCAMRALGAFEHERTTI